MSAIPPELIQQVAINGIFTGLLWLAIKRPLDRETRERETLQKDVKDLTERRMVTIETDHKEDSEKRKKIYEDMEHIRLNWMSEKRCREIHALLTAQLEDYMAAVLKLERVSTEVARLVGWVDDVSKEQISIGKDLSAIGAEVKNLRSPK